MEIRAITYTLSCRQTYGGTDLGYIRVGSIEMTNDELLAPLAELAQAILEGRVYFRAERQNESSSWRILEVSIAEKAGE